MPATEIPKLELGSGPTTPTIVSSRSASDVSSASSPEPQLVEATPLFRALALPPPEPEQPPGQDELERRLPGYRRIVIPRELTLIELLKECSGANTDEEVLRIREARLRVIAERVGLRRLHVLAPRLKQLTLDGSALSSLRDLGIGLIHLKILSVKRCSLTTFDGVWGLGALRELYASGNKLNDLNPLAALQKLHTLDLSENPLSESGRLWTLGVCSSLRTLTLRGCPVSEEPQYRTKLASALPLLVYLDGRPLHTDIIYDPNDEIFGIPVSSDSESELEFGDSNSHSSNQQDVDVVRCDVDADGDHRRPATTEGAGERPRPSVAPRPRTAHACGRDRSGATSRLEILNTLLDGEWRCSGSNLTSRDAVCGNLAQALRRRPRTAGSNVSLHQSDCDNSTGNGGDSVINSQEATVVSETRSIAAEIPVLPLDEDWDKFRRDTGIDIQLDFNERPSSADAAEVIEKLEQIERETFDRLQNCNVNENFDYQAFVEGIFRDRADRMSSSYVRNNHSDSNSEASNDLESSLTTTFK